MSCAPSLRMVHQGNKYFEHCYGADFDAKITPQQREACWSAWLADYTRHQPASRIDYAMRRVEAIQAGDQTLKLPGLPGGQTEAPTDRVAESLVTHGGPLAGATVATTVVPSGVQKAPTHGCMDACHDVRVTCEASCPDERRTHCVMLCKRDKEICLKGCY